MGRHSNWDPGTPRPVRRPLPLYGRVLRLRHIQPGGVACFFFFEGMIGLAAVLALTGLVSWWAVVVLPVCVATMVKLNDLVAGLLAPSPAPRNRTVVIREEESVRRAAANRADAPQRRQPREIEAPPQLPATRPDGGRLSRPAGEQPKQATAPGTEVSRQRQTGAGRPGANRPAIAGPPRTPPRAIETGAPPRRDAGSAGSEAAATKNAALPAARPPRRRAIEPPPKVAPERAAGDIVAPSASALQPAQPDALVDFLSDIQDDGAPLSSDAATPESASPAPAGPAAAGPAPAGSAAAPASPAPATDEDELPENVRHTGGAHLPARPPDPAQVSAQRRARRSTRAGREKHG